MGGHCLGTLNVRNLSVPTPLLPVGITTGYLLEMRGSILDREETREFSLLHSVQNGSEAHQAIYPVDTGGFSLGPFAEVKNPGAITSLSHIFS
jgi:hypothetical protein